MPLVVIEFGDWTTDIRSDVTNVEDLDRLFAQDQDQFGRIDVLFANAGIAPLLSEGASIILNASISAQSGLPNMSIYSATKAASIVETHACSGTRASRNPCQRC